MDHVDNSGGTGQGFSKSFEKTESNSPGRTTFSDKIGVAEIYSWQMWKAALTETVATIFFIFTLVSFIIASFESRVSEPRLLLLITVFIPCFLFIWVMFPLSGAFMNPMITLIVALVGGVTTVRAIVYFLGQLGGSIFAYFLLKIVMSDEMVDKYLVGGCPINRDGTGISLGTALLLEFMCCFIVLLTSMTVIFDKKRFKELGVTAGCALIAASISVAIFVSVMITGQPGYAAAGLNPARCLGPALVLGKHDLWHGQWVFWVGPFLACIVYYAYAKTLPEVESVY